jgi:hypothetical protein
VVERLLQRDAVARGHEHGAVVRDVDLAAGLLDDPADRLAAGPDQVADAVLLDLDRDDARRVHRELAARPIDRGRHLFEDVEAALPRLLEGL